MTAYNAIGPMIDAFMVEGWVSALLDKWYLTYMAEFERQRGKAAGYWGEPFLIESSSTFDVWSEDKLPHIVIVSPGLNDEPVRRGDGSFEAAWVIVVTSIVYGTTRSRTRENMAANGAVTKTILAQHADLEQPDHVASVRWVDEDFTQIDSNDSRTLGAASEAYVVTVQGVMNDMGGPPNVDPPVDPYQPPPGPVPVVLPGKTYAELFKEGER